MKLLAVPQDGENATSQCDHWDTSQTAIAGKQLLTCDDQKGVVQQISTHC